jgi:circadian clock protein KaiC
VTHDRDHAPERATTGVPGLDTILAGGLLRRSTTIIQGAPGSGKTVLANQIAFHFTTRGARAVYVTLLSESHGALLRHLGSLSFFDPAAVGDRIQFLSGFTALRDGTGALLRLLQQEILPHRPELVVIDGIGSIQELHGATALRHFVHELAASIEAANSTCLLISASAVTPTPEDTVVDNILFLQESAIGLRAVRHLRVNKSRGSACVPGRHVFVIDGNGIKLFPRIEALYRDPSRLPGEDPTLVSIGHDSLDAMLGGGLRAGTSTLLLGATGTGKTLLGLSFLAAGLRQGERAVYAGFFEAPQRLIASGEGIGLDLRQPADAGLLHINWQAPVELLLDAWGHRLLETVASLRPTRMVIDGLNALEASAAFTDRFAPFLTALLNELRSHGVTTLVSAEVHPIIGPGVDVPLPGVSPLVENSIVLRYVEIESRLRRLIAVLKVRGRAHAIEMRELHIGPAGLEVGAAFESAEALLTGSARRPRGAPRRDADAR